MIKLFKKITLIKHNPVAKIFVFLVLFLIISSWLITWTEKNNDITDYFDSVWWTFVTITTVGYGDYVPKSIYGKLLGIIIMVIGLFLLSFITGQFATFMINREELKKKGLIPLRNMKNHFIICGWRDDLGPIIELICGNDMNKDKRIIIINNQSSDIIEPILNDLKNYSVQFLKGDYMNSSILENASIKGAEKVIVLADKSENASKREIDSKTVMTVINIKNINPKCYVIAELLDDKFSHYLEITQCDEIVSTNHFNRRVLSQTMINGGLSSVIDKLFSDHILLKDIPDDYTHLDYTSISNKFTQNNEIIIGILENTGNLYQRKKDAINDAQKTADISKLVDNLKVAKELRSNIPIINPPDNYQIKRNSKLIIIRS